MELENFCEDFDIVGKAVRHHDDAGVGMDEGGKFFGGGGDGVGGGEAVARGEAGAGVEDVDGPGEFGGDSRDGLGIVACAAEK